MNETRDLNKLMDTIVWGALFVWWGLSCVPHFLPNGLDAAGTGVILLGLNVVRISMGMRVNGFSLALGIITLAWGAMDITRSVFHVPYRLPVFAVLLILVGVILFTAAMLKARRTNAQ